MVRQYSLTFLGIILLSISTGFAQETLPYKKTAFSFNITSALINEYNFGIEQFVSVRKSIAVDFGIIYANEAMQNFAESFTNDPLFYEEGFAVRAQMKIWRTKENSKWRYNLAPGLLYKHTSYTDFPITVTGKTDSGGRTY